MIIFRTTIIQNYLFGIIKKKIHSGYRKCIADYTHTPQKSKQIHDSSQGTFLTAVMKYNRHIITTYLNLTSINF